MSLSKEKQDRVKDDFNLYKSKMSNEDSLNRIEFYEKSKIAQPRPKGDLGVDYIYILQHQVALKWFFDIFQTHGNKFLFGRENPDAFACLDVGSKFSFVTMLSTFVNFIMADPSLNLNGPVFSPSMGLFCMNDEAQNLSSIKSSSINLLTSLHAIEHFGLGRYGDTIDPKGDISGLKEFNRVLSNKGYFIGAVPIEKEGRQRIVFNENRIYSISSVNKMLEDTGFKVIRHTAVICPTAYIVETVAGKKVPLTHINPDSFEKVAEHWEKADSLFIDDPPDSVYIWMAQKV